MQHLVDVRYPDAIKITVVHDQLNTHVKASVYKAFEPAKAKRILDKLEFHYTPKHGSWLDMAEIELSVLARECLDRRIPDKITLLKEVAAWELRRNQGERTVDWQFTTADARIKLKRLYPSIIFARQIFNTDVDAGGNLNDTTDLYTNGTSKAWQYAPQYCFY